MANDIDCELRVSGPTHEINAFIERVATDDRVIDFWKIAPPPPDLGSANVHAWLDRAWGTRSNAYDDSRIEDSRLTDSAHAKVEALLSRKKVRYQFTTAWTPPFGIVETAAAEYPKLRFSLRWMDRGFNRRGTMAMKGQRTLRDSSYYFGD
jgi:hypothetical protein